MKYSPSISNFIGKFSSLSHSIVFYYKINRYKFRYITWINNKDLLYSTCCVFVLICVHLFMTHGLGPTRLHCPSISQAGKYSISFWSRSSWPRNWIRLLCLLLWQANSFPLSHQGSPEEKIQVKSKRAEDRRIKCRVVNSPPSDPSSCSQKILAGQQILKWRTWQKQNRTKQEWNI